MSNKTACIGRLSGALAMLFLVSVDALSQTASAPSRTQCKQWDDAFLSIIDWSVLGTFIGALVLNLFAGVLGKYFWLFTAPRIRILVTTLACILLVLLGIGFGPWIIGLGRLWFTGVDPRYFDCATLNYGARGLFTGLFNVGVPAIAQVPAIIVALVNVAIVGGALSWVLSEFVFLRFWGLPAKVKGEAQ